MTVHIKFSESANRDTVSPYTITVLASIASASGVEAFTVTSTQRSAVGQARAMVQMILRSKEGYADARGLYAEPGQHVLDVWDGGRDLSLSVEQITYMMARKIVELGPENVSHHCGDPKKINVLDIAPSSIPEEKHQAFLTAARSDSRVTKLLAPHQGDPAFHFEIAQPAQDLAA